MSSTGLFTGRNRRTARSAAGWSVDENGKVIYGGDDTGKVTTTDDPTGVCNGDQSCIDDFLKKVNDITSGGGGTGQVIGGVGSIGGGGENTEVTTGGGGTTNFEDGAGGGGGTGGGDKVNPPKPSQPPALQSYTVDYILVGLCLVGVATAVYMFSK